MLSILEKERWTVKVTVPERQYFPSPPVKEDYIKDPVTAVMQLFSRSKAPEGRRGRRES